MVVMPGLSLCTSRLPCWPALLGLHTYRAALGQQNALKYFGCNSPWAGHPGSSFHSDHLCTVFAFTLVIQMREVEVFIRILQWGPPLVLIKCLYNMGHRKWEMAPVFVSNCHSQSH